MSIQKNATVKAIAGVYDGRVGKVCNVYPEIDLAVVSFEDNGDIGKVSLSYLVEVQPQAEQIVDVKIEIPEGAKKISRADFDAALAEITDPDKMFKSGHDALGVIIRGLIAKVVGDSVREKIFEDQEVVVITAETFTVALWDACNPVAVNKATTGGKTSDRKALKVAITAIITLEEMVDILFGEERG